MAAITSNTTTISYDGGAIADVVSISAPSVTIATIDATSMADIYRTFLGGTIDSGEVSVEFQYSAAGGGIGGLTDQWEAGLTVNPVAKEVVITFSDTSTYTFNAIITGFQVNAASDSVVTGTASFKVTGAITVA